jgi:hypothetical protein
MKRSISGIIRSELAIIENLQFNGYDLNAILQYLKEKHEVAELNLNTFIVSLYRARKKHLKLGIQTKNLADEINLNLEIPKKTPKKDFITHQTITNESDAPQNKALSAEEFDQIIARKASEQTAVAHAHAKTSFDHDLTTQQNTVISTKTENQPKLLIKQVRDIFKSKTDISDLL